MHFILHSISQYFTILTPLLTSYIPIILCFKAIKNRGYYTSLNCFKGVKYYFIILSKGGRFCPKIISYLQVILPDIALFLKVIL